MFFQNFQFLPLKFVSFGYLSEESCCIVNWPTTKPAALKKIVLTFIYRFEFSLPDLEIKIELRHFFTRGKPTIIFFSIIISTKQNSHKLGAKHLG